jgi:hypothetical protein
MKVTVIKNPPPETLNNSSIGVIHLEGYESAEEHPSIKKHKKISPFGDSYLAKRGTTDFFSWITPITGGYYKATTPIFKIDLKPCASTT